MQVVDFSHWKDYIPLTYSRPTKGAFAVASTKGLVRVNPLPRGRAAELCDFWVVPECRGQGIGMTLLREAMRVARVFGMRRLWLWTLAESGPVALYERAGFRVALRGVPQRLETSSLRLRHPWLGENVVVQMVAAFVDDDAA